MTLYPVKILSTGETMYFEHRSRTNQLWHEFLMSGYDDFDQWERDGYPEDITPRDARIRYERITRDIWALLDELDQLIILRAEYHELEAKKCCEPQSQNQAQEVACQTDKATRSSWEARS
jgi:hypothetical protein